MTAIKGRTASKKKTAVFLVDDHDMVEAGVRTIMSEAPERDLTFAGSAKVFGSDVHDLIRQSGADVVLIDITDSFRDPVGLSTIRATRRKFGSALGIIAYTVYPEYRDAALACGADKFLQKGATNEIHRQAVRNCKAHDVFSKLELFLAEREIKVSATCSGILKREQRINLSRDGFALLYYLAEECAHGEIDWIAKDDRDEKSLPYEFRKAEFWSKVRARWIERGPLEAGKRVEMDITRYSCMINREIRDSLQDESLQLIIVPGGGRKGHNSYNNSYYLNPFIERSQVFFHGVRIERG